MEPNPIDQEHTRRTQWDFSDLRALFINCTLKRSPELSNTQGLIDISESIMAAQGVIVETIRAVDHDVATGVWPDMTEHGWERDEWPAIFEKVRAAGHPRPRIRHLARGEDVRVHQGHRTSVR